MLILDVDDSAALLDHVDFLPRHRMVLSEYLNLLAIDVESIVSARLRQESLLVAN